MGTKKQASLGMSDCWTIRETSGKKTFSFLGSLIIMSAGFKIKSKSKKLEKNVIDVLQKERRR